MAEPPTISVVISSFYGKKYISKAIESVKNQTFTDWELLIIDDTNGKEDLSEFEDEALNIRTYKTNDIGLSNLRMFGAEHASGEFYLFMDADDMIKETFLEKTYAAIERSKRSIAYTDTQHFGESNGYWVSPEYSFALLMLQNFMVSCSLIRASHFWLAGGYDTNNFNYWEDYQLWLRMGAKGYYGIHVPEKLFCYRIRKDSGMQSKRNEVLAPFYKSYIITTLPDLYHPDVLHSAQKNVDMLPENFIQWKPSAQEEWLEVRGYLE